MAAKEKVLELWARTGRRALRSGSLFKQPAALRAANASVLAGAPENAKTANPRFFERSLFLYDGEEWKAVNFSPTFAPPRGITPVTFTKGDHLTPGNKNLLQWDTDASFFYLSSFGSEVWRRTLLVEGILPGTILYMDGAPMGDTEGKALISVIPEDGSGPPAEEEIIGTGVLLAGAWTDEGSWDDFSLWTDGV